MHPVWQPAKKYEGRYPMDEYYVIKKVKDEGLTAGYAGGPGAHAYLLLSNHLARTPRGRYSVDQVLQDLDALISAAEMVKKQLEAARAAKS
jgi:hypothetical protein